MFRKSFGTCVCVVLFALLSTSCAKKETTATTVAAETTETVPPAPVSETATITIGGGATATAITTTSTTESPIGVAPCDDYLTKYALCVMNKVPVSERARFNASVQERRNQWRQLAANPQTKDTLTYLCNEASKAAKQSMGVYGCEF